MVGTISSGYLKSGTLRSIDFSGNALSGEFSTDISEDSNLFSINFASNFLDGSIPSQIKNIAGLTTFNIESNKFSGPFPASLYTLPLTELSIGGNELTGTIPGNLTGIPTLTSISLGPNLFVGDIPTELSELTGLKKLSMVGIPDMTGRLPASYGLNLTDLVELSVSGSSVGGDIPYQYTELTNLETLRLSNNDLRGRIPPQLGLLSNLSKYFSPSTVPLFVTLILSVSKPNFLFFVFTEILALDGNVFTGTMPSTMGELTSIQELRFDNNELYGTIPEEFENLSAISKCFKLCRKVFQAFLVGHCIKIN